MEKNILIVDSDSRQRLKIARLVHGVAAESNVKVKIYRAVNAVRATRILEQNDIDMLILNTTYPKAFSRELSGICLVESLRKIQKYTFLPVIFISSREDMRRYAFTELNCLGYQPFEFDEVALGKVVRKGLNHTTKRDRDVELCLKTSSIMRLVLVKDIVYIESKNRAIQFWLSDGSGVRVPYKNLSDVKEKIKNKCLIQCGRDTIINRDYIEKVDEKTVFLFKGNESISLKVGENYWNAVEAAVL